MIKEETIVHVYCDCCGKEIPKEKFEEYDSYFYDVGYYMDCVKRVEFGFATHEIDAPTHRSHLCVPCKRKILSKVLERLEELERKTE